MDALEFAYRCLRDDDITTAMETFAALHALATPPAMSMAARWSVLAEAEQFGAVGESWADAAAQHLRDWCQRAELDEHIRTVAGPWSSSAEVGQQRYVRPMELPADGPIWSPTARVEQRAERVWVIDGVLDEEVLAEVHASLSRSTIWRTPYAARYCGAFLETGLASRPLAQLVDTLRRHAPGVLPEHRVAQVWAFRCEPESPGLDVHADGSELNINLWTTPDRYCDAPEQSGLDVWPISAPQGTPFAKVNGDTAWSRRYVADAGVEPIRIPYRANRAVVFDASQFHASAGSVFAGGVEGRRINVTVLLRAASR